ncbi:MAG: hypothetical protein M3N46_14805 [Actinomycetota bacterium]|nr:hypothetical protein [Actinomycetota bacterium]
MVAGSMSVVTRQVLKTNTDENQNAALSAAYAGIEEYQSRLSNDSTYYTYGNPSAPFSASSSALLTLPTGANANPAFNIDSSWAQIPGSTDSWYRYEVDTSQYQNQGTIRLRSTGKVGQSVRSVVANLRQKGFIDNLYFTDYETSDPVLGVNKGVNNPLTGKNVCAVHLWEVPTRPGSCPTIQFGAYDVLQGPVHSNDTLTVCGATFKQAVTTSSTSTPNYNVPNGCADGVFTVGKPQYTPSLLFPPTNSQMKTETRNDLPMTVPRPGCLYTGPTVITFSVVSGVGYMRVVSPYTKFTETAGNNTGTNPPACGLISDLQSTSGALIPVLSSNLVYVQSVPTTPTDPNYTATGAIPVAGYSCITSTNGDGNSVSSGGWKYGTYQYPMNNEILPSSSQSDTPAYSCRNGDVYVSGQMSGALTVATDNYVYVTSDLKYYNTSSDILGLVGQNAIWVYNPILCTKYSSGTNCSNYAYGVSGSNREVDAALLSVAHTFAVQNYDAGTSTLGSRGTLTVNGAIAQEFRGTVATGGASIATGYAKNYVYDTRFRYTAPPKFLTPTSTTYGVTQYASTKSAFMPDGSVAP